MQACAQAANAPTYMIFQMLASNCGLPADTVNLTPPALTTCAGVAVKLMSVSM